MADDSSVTSSGVRSCWIPVVRGPSIQIKEGSGSEWSGRVDNNSLIFSISQRILGLVEIGRGPGSGAVGGQWWSGVRGDGRDDLRQFPPPRPPKCPRELSPSNLSFATLPSRKILQSSEFSSEHS